MKDKKIKNKPPLRYRGRLSPAQIASGINAAHANAKRLVIDSAIMLAAERYPSASALAILAIEEAGKEKILRQLAISTSDAQVVKAWKDFRDHAKKNTHWQEFVRILLNGPFKVNLPPLSAEEAMLPSIIEDVKQLCIYTDFEFIGEEHWSEPERLVSKEGASKFVQMAQIVVGMLHVCSVREIELYIEYLAGHALQSEEDLKTALVVLWDALQAEGLVAGGKNLMREGTGSGLDS